MKGNIFILALTVLFTALPGPQLLAAEYDAVKSKLENAMASDVRTSADIERDGNRKPVETLEFFGLRDDMKIVELFPGGGWYTALLAPVMADNGEFYVAFGTSRVQETLMGKPGYEKIQILGADAKMSRAEGARYYTASNTDLDVEDVDSLLAAFSSAQPQVVVNCIGLVKQLSAAKDPLSTIPINSLLPHRLARLCSVAECRIVSS